MSAGYGKDKRWRDAHQQSNFSKPQFFFFFFKYKQPLETTFAPPFCHLQFCFGFNSLSLCMVLLSSLFFFFFRFPLPPPSLLSSSPPPPLPPHGGLDACIFIVLVSIIIIMRPRKKANLEFHMEGGAGGRGKKTQNGICITSSSLCVCVCVFRTYGKKPIFGGGQCFVVEHKKVLLFLQPLFFMVNRLWCPDAFSPPPPPLTSLPRPLSWLMIGLVYRRRSSSSSSSSSFSISYPPSSSFSSYEQHPFIPHTIPASHFSPSPPPLSEHMRCKAIFFPRIHDSFRCHPHRLLSSLLLEMTLLFRLPSTARRDFST